MARHHIAKSFGSFLSPLQAHALEHACYTFALSCKVSYERTALRCLYLFQKKHLDSDMFSLLGAQTIVSVPLECLVPEIPVRDIIKAKELEHCKSEALLKDLTTAEASCDLPDTGVRCKNCGSNDITHKFLQTRSADEGTTIFCTCGGCKKRWKM